MDSEPDTIHAPLIVSRDLSNLASDPSFARWFRPLEKLRALVWDRRPIGPLERERPNGGIVLAMIYFRALPSFDAVVILADRGYGRNALMIGRSLFEDMVIARWTTLNRGRRRSSS